MSVDPVALWRDVLVAADGARPVLLIDGGSGSGKTTLGRAVAAASGVRLVSLDEFYPGWDGLAAASTAVAQQVLAPEHPGYRRWDWATGRPGEWVALEAGRPLIVEGSGALTPAARARASYAVWLECPAALRKERALARDGASYAPHWERWAAQEAAHLAAHRPDLLADRLLSCPQATT